jgi:hypothetical protein
LEAWEKVLVDADFLEDVHAAPGCISCHGGTPEVIDKAKAHTGLKAKASAQPEQSCGTCHVGVVEDARDSSHRMQWCYQSVLEARGADFTNPELVTAYNTHCTKCHADCGDCHISRPSALEGGLIAGHEVKRVASVFVTCGGCHSARINDEYKGVHEGIPADLHWEQEGMPCTECHGIEQFHDGEHGSTRYTTTSGSMSCTWRRCNARSAMRPGSTSRAPTATLAKMTRASPIPPPTRRR